VPGNLAKPAASGRALMRRVEYILENTIVDESPTTIFRKSEPEPESEPHTRAGGSWRADLSGYDGWLAGNGGDAESPA